eukprot:CAMPEP_0198152758 /NCGR_PEP_ID=MMETSP1443-20131203/61216_1 /TAXON_ID=186043 /ORGANISM="Entomoneis sp., Strain CCMP2396" /LENGTH=104 /DNA_ID=CAMNT_0043818879 /DNA_START=95 /DNA_END=409 /DNA_ORIENTATION=-
MTTFGEDINSLTLIPSRPPAKGGAFLVSVTTTTSSCPVTVWDRVAQEGFPEIKELKQKIRDLLNPGKDLGRVDGAKFSTTTATAAVDPMEDDDAEEARKFFGVM